MPAMNKRRLLQMAVGRLVVAAVVVGARFGVEQDGGDHRLHVAPHAVAVIGKSRGNALDVGRDSDCS